SPARLRDWQVLDETPLSRPWPAAPASGPRHEHASTQQQARHDRAEQQRQAQGLRDPRLVLVQRADDLQYPADVPLLPVLAPRLGVGVVTLDAGALHNARLGVANDPLPAEFGELVDRLLPLALAQTQERHALELIPWAAVGPPGARFVAVLSHLHAGPARLGQLLADVVQEGCRDAERHGIRRGWDGLVNRIIRLLHTLDNPAVLPGGFLQQLRLLGGTLQGAGADQPGGQQR